MVTQHTTTTMISLNQFQQQQQPEPEPAEAEGEGFETVLARIQCSVRDYIDSFSSQSSSSSSFQHQQQHNSNHHDRQSLALPTQFRSSSANRGHANEEDEEADAAETERASAAGSRHDDHPNSSTSIGHRGHYPLWTWCKNNLILLSFIAMTLSTLGLVYNKNRQLQKQITSLETQLTEYQNKSIAMMLTALPKHEEEGMEEEGMEDKGMEDEDDDEEEGTEEEEEEEGQPMPTVVAPFVSDEKKGKTPKQKKPSDCECASSQPSVSRVGMISLNLEVQLSPFHYVCEMNCVFLILIMDSPLASLVLVICMYSDSDIIHPVIKSIRIRLSKLSSIRETVNLC